MELIRKLVPKLDKNGHLQSYGEFLCHFCLKKVIKRLGHGKRDKSCGCKTQEFKSESQKGNFHDDGTKQKISIKNKGKKRTLETKQKQSQIKKGKSSPRKGQKNTKEHNQKISKTKKGCYIGESSWLWQNGKSFEPYSPEFNKDKKQFILERDNYTCQDPHCEHKSNKLHIHHIDYDKKNSNPENLITLCASCHTKTNGKNKRQYYTEFYQNRLINRIVEYLL